MASASALQKAGQVWCRPEVSDIEMNVRLAVAFAEVLDEIWNQPWLGNATTKELRDELVSRGPDSPDDYRTHRPSEGKSSP